MTVLWEGFLQGLSGVWTIALIVVPLMIILEIAEKNGLLQKLNRLMARPFRSLGLSEEGAFPIVIAMVFGITYGSGVIINHVRTGQVTREEATVIGTFIAIAHALIEDTILFLAVGAPFFLLFVPRVVLAYAMSFLVHRRTAKLASAQGQHLDTLD